MQSRRSTQVTGERVECSHAKPFEVADISGHDRQIVHDGCCSNHCVFGEVIRPSVYETSPGAECAGIHRQHVERLDHAVEPSLISTAFAGFCSRVISMPA